MENVPAEDRLWVALREGLLSERLLRSFAVYCARSVYPLMADERSRFAVEFMEAYCEWRYLSNDPDWVPMWENERDAAWDAARDAARYAPVAAARYAAEAAAWDAAGGAARAVARAVARDAVRAAAGDSAVDAAGDAARYVQIKKLIEMIEEEV